MTTRVQLPHNLTAIVYSHADIAAHQADDDGHPPDEDKK